MAKIVHHRRFLTKRPEGGFHMSIGDIMAALLLVVVLLLVATITQLAENNSTVESIAEEYQNTREAIVEALREEFEEDFEEWGAELLHETLTVRFPEKVGFEPNESDLKPEFQRILSDFVPRYINVLYREEFREYITDVLIEGHTANPRDEFDFVSPMDLAFRRSFVVLATSYESFVSTQNGSNPDIVRWFEERVGLAEYSHGRPVRDSANGTLWDRSRRVDFRVITNADEQLDRILRSVAGE